MVLLVKEYNVPSKMKDYYFGCTGYAPQFKITYKPEIKFKKINNMKVYFVGHNFSTPSYFEKVCPTTSLSDTDTVVFFAADDFILGKAVALKKKIYYDGVCPTYNLHKFGTRVNNVEDIIPEPEKLTIYPVGGSFEFERFSVDNEWNRHMNGEKTLDIDSEDFSLTSVIALRNHLTAMIDKY